MQKILSQSSLLKVTLNISLGAFFHGYSFTYLNAIEYSTLSQIFNLQDYPPEITQGLLTGSNCYTGGIGCLLAYFLLLRFSRYKCLLFVSISGVFTSLLLLLPNAATLVFARLAQGITIGVISSINPIFIKQFIPKELLGKLWTIHQVTFTIGLSFSFAIVFFCSRILQMDEDSYWRVLFGFTALTSGFQCYNLLYIYPYDTPKYLMSVGKHDQARELLTVIYKPQIVEVAYQEILKIYEPRSDVQLVSVHQMAQKQSQQSLSEILLQQKQKQIQQQNNLKTNSVAMFCAVSLAIFHQLYGQPLIVQYGIEVANRTFPSLWDTFPLLINLSANFGAVFAIYVVQNYGRRQLMLKGGASLALFLLLISFLFTQVNTFDPQSSPVFPRLIICVAIICHRIIGSITIGPISWLIMPQIVQPHIVPFCSMAYWMSLALINTVTPLLIMNHTSLTFFLCGLMSIIACIINKYTLIETAGKSEWQIRKQYRKKWE